MNITLIILFLVAILVYGYIYKIPIICYGCETPEGVTSMFFKCIIDTTKDSEMCKISQKVDSIVEDIADAGSKVTGAIVSEVGKLPETIKNAYDNVYQIIQDIVRFILDNINNLSKVIQGFMTSAFNEIKNVSITRIQDLYTLVITPLLDYITKYVTEPIFLAIKKITEFKDFIKDSITSAYTQMTNQVIDIKDKLVNVITRIPEFIELAINKIIWLINESVEKTVNGLNKGIGGILDATDKTIDTLAGTLNKATGGVADASKEVAKAVEFSVNQTIGFINDKTIDNINKMLDPGMRILSEELTKVLVNPLNEVTSGMAKTTNDAINPIIGTINKTSEGINKVIEFKIPKVTLPTLQIPGVGLPFNINIPPVTIINETQIVPETRILPGVNNINPVNPINVSVPKIQPITINPPKKLERIGNVTIPINYNIPTVGPPGNNPPGQYITLPNNQDRNQIIPPAKKIEDVDLDPAMQTLKNAMLMPIDFFSSKIQAIYDQTMGPINKVIEYLTSLYCAIKANIVYLFRTYVNKEYLFYIMGEIKRTGSIIVQDALNIMNIYVINPAIQIFNDIKAKLMGYIEIVIDIIKKLFQDVKVLLYALFEKVSALIYDAGKFIIKMGGYFTFFTTANFIDRVVIPIKGIPKTTKLTFVMVMILSFIYIYVKFYYDGFVKIAPYLLVAVAILLVSGRYMKNNQNINVFENGEIEYKEDQETSYIEEESYIEEIPEGEEELYENFVV